MAEIFGGIGGGLRSCELAGHNVAAAVVIEKRASARAVVAHYWPTAFLMESVTDSMREAIRVAGMLSQSWSATDPGSRIVPVSTDIAVGVVKS